MPKNNDINPILTGRFGASESDEAPLLYKFTKWNCSKFNEII